MTREVLVNDLLGGVNQYVLFSIGMTRSRLSKIKLTHPMHLGILHLHIDHRAQCVEDAALLVAPAQQHLRHRLKAVPLKGAVLGASESRQIQNDAAAQLDHLLVHLRPNRLRHYPVAECSDELCVGDQRLRHFARYFY